MRSVAVAVLLGLGALLAFTSNATVWTNRTVFHEDQFVSTVDRTLDDPQVQQQLSVRLSNAIVDRGDLESRIREALPEELRLLAVPLTQTTREVVQRQTLRFLQSDASAAVLDTALRQLHTRVIAFIEDPDGYRVELIEQKP